MDEQRQLLFVNHFLPSNEQKLIDRLRDAASRRVMRPAEAASFAPLRNTPIDSIADVVVGPNFVGVLFTDGQIGRIPYEATSRPFAPSATPAKSAAVPAAAGSGGGGGGGSSRAGGAASGGSARDAAQAVLADRTAKLRRVMLAAASGSRRDHRGVIIDRAPARPRVAASAVPEHLIAQAQAVLQGKTREVIIRELQRTNNNVNAAVNNLLSRDDDDDEGGEEAGGGAEMYLPDELLLLLEGTHAAELYGAGTMELLMSGRSERRPKGDKDKEKHKSAKSSSDTEALRRYEIANGSITEPWEGVDNKEEAAKEGGRRFARIACTQSELLAISADGKLYGWKWSEAAGDATPHVMHEKMRLADGETLTHIAACSLRVAVMTSSGRISTWLDTVACGDRLSEALFVPPQQLEEPVEQLVVSNQMAVARCPNNVFFWCGLYPVADRRAAFEKVRTKQRELVVADNTPIVEGSEVRAKSGPIYSIGCIAAFFGSPTPMIGILMEDAWTLSEACRFRVLAPTAYDADRFDPAAVATVDADSGAESSRHREEAWQVSDVIFIHEEVHNDTAVVKIVDGSHCAVEYQPAPASPTDTYATTASKALVTKGEKDKAPQKMRLIRRDELTVVSDKMSHVRSPQSMRIEPYKFVLSGSSSSKRVISAVADSHGIRALVERRGGGATIDRVTVCGRTLTTHALPLHAPALHASPAMHQEEGGGGGKPTLLNYGDDAILLLRDAHGGILPLVRDAGAGFREPTYLQLPASSITALTVKRVSKDRPSWAPKANREAVIVTLQGTHPQTVERRLPSLMYAVMCCDDKAVKALLDALQNEDGFSIAQREVAEARADGARNVLHAAVMCAFATKNAIDADVEKQLTAVSTTTTRTSASLSEQSTQADSIVNGGDGAAAATPPPAPSEDAIMAVVPEPMPEVPDVEIGEESDENALLVTPSPVENARQRQQNAIAIVKLLVTHPICMPFLNDLLSGRDITGQTPFMAAVNHRAYTAARSIFEAIESLFVHGHKFSFQLADSLLPFIFPAGCRADDSPLFILCYNDTCSFTWTGDEHIHQDVFECRTCGLIGTLCCCTECAFTCHRNHDCKLKRASPSAFCDCKEKACCKARVTGNQHARESLLSSLITKSNLYTMLNGRGEHVLLYLARKLARLSSEQWSYTRRHPRARDAQTPEMDRPKFARRALLHCLRNWNVMRSMAMIGVRQMDHSIPRAEEIFHLNAQHGSSHLDKFMLILLTKCCDESNSVLECLLGVLTEAHNRARASGENLEEVNFVISRFVRSVARLFILAVVISGVAASTAVSGLVPAKESGRSSSSRLDRPSITSISLSGMFNIRKDPSKDSKLKNMRMFIVRCKVFFEHFAVFTLHEMAQLADASLAPVRTGILRPCVSLAAVLGSTADSIENLEKYINSEPDVTQSMGKPEQDGGELKRRRKRSSRRDSDREEEEEGSQREETRRGVGPGRAAAARPPPTARAVLDVDFSDFTSSDSDSDGDGNVSRRTTSQSEATAANEEARANEEESARQRGGDDVDTSDDANTEDELESDGEDEEHGDEQEHEEEGDEVMERDGEEEDEDMDSATSEDDAPSLEIAGEERRRRMNRGEAGADDGNATRDEAIIDVGEQQRRDDEDVEMAEVARAEIAVEVVDVQREGAGEEEEERERSAARTRARRSEDSRRPAAASAVEAAEAALVASSRNREAALLMGYPQYARRGAHGTTSHAIPHGVMHGRQAVGARLTSRRNDPAAADVPRMTAARVVTASSSGGGTSSEETAGGVGAGMREDETPTTHKTGIQLAAAFSFAVRVIGDLLPVVAAGSTPAADGRASASFSDVDQLNEMEDAVRRRAIDHVSTRLEDSWKWLALVLDHAEAQIKYINAVESKDEAKKKEGSKERKKKVAAPSPLSASRAKRESIACLLGVLRAHSGEAGDGTPHLDLETLRAPALVVDAYLGFVESMAEAEKLMEHSKKKETDSAAIKSRGSMTSLLRAGIGGDNEIVGVRRFYQRSNSVSFAGASFTDAHDTLQQSCAHSLPIVERPQLLTSTVEKDVIFGPPASTQERTREEHDKVMRSHGVSHPHNQSLTAAPISSHRLFVEGEDKKEEVEMMDEGDHTVQPSRPASVAATMHDMGLEEGDEEGEKENESPKSPKSKRGRKRGRSAADAKRKPKARIAQQMDVDEVIVMDDAMTQQPPVGFEKVTYEEILETFKRFREHPLRKLMGRWRFALQLIAKELHGDLTDALGGDLAGSRLLKELAGFEMKQNELRTRMEKYRATATKDLSIEVRRDPAELIRETCYQLNRAYTRRIALKRTERGGGSSGSSKKDDTLPVLASRQVKVKFTDEPGEGTGVARSYYTALAEALASLRALPFTDYGYTADNDEYLYGGGPPPPTNTPVAAAAAPSFGRRPQIIRGVSASSAAGGAGRRIVAAFDRRIPLNSHLPPYTPADMAVAESLPVTHEFLMEMREETYARREPADKLPSDLTDRLFILIRALYPSAAARLTGMFMDLPLSHITLVLGDKTALRAYVADAIDLLMTNGAPTDIAMLRGEDEKNDLLLAASLSSSSSTEADDAPLFFRPSKTAHYSPVPGRLSPARISAFRNVGRVIGLCLMQCEMFPLRLSRHVLKYILGRPLNWHDFAFYDPQMFESLRKLIVDGCSTPNHGQYFDDLQMTFSIDMTTEATGMPSTTLDLIPGGADVLVAKDNIIEYVYRYVEARLLGTTNGRCLAAIRQGVQDVVPQSMLDNLTAEDLRLVLCGTETVSLSLMQSYTAWTDESHAAPETIAKFKQWFWQVADRLSPEEKQDLIFFWTGAPSLPSTEEGFQPLPTIVIRPTDDGFLPTANTCISRLYLPLYNSKKTLTAKLQLAIKAKNFGFV